MPISTLIKPAHKAVVAYYHTLEQYSGQRVEHELAVRSAFQNLLAETAKPHGWMLIPELIKKVSGRSLRPDGTLRDTNSLPRGYWEAKDSSDDLDAEIKKKTKLGYPLTNTIFEDTRAAVLFQNKREAMRVQLADRQQLCNLLNLFYSHTEPDFETFEQAVEEFKDRVPELGRGLAVKIADAHRDNQRFQKAFDTFFQLCQTALNPNIRREAVDEMLVQHVLTERLIRTIFHKDDFTRQNVIAAEVENVIDALVQGKSFSRRDYLRSLDPFYVAIENAARNLEDFTDKQHLLNTVYERFFQGFSVKAADTMGIVYTPQPIVDLMCASVAEVLDTEFGLSLGSPEVQILDPCTGTGNFIVNLLGRIPKRDLARMYREQLYANEVMLMPYYIAALNIEHAYYELTGQYEPFDGLCFVDTLDMAEGSQRLLAYMTEKNTARVERQKKAPITVVIGNPPYNMNQQNENDNNKNRKYAVVDSRIKDTYAKDSNATLNNKLYDPYVKFFRWATDRLDGDGILCFVTNNSFIDKLAFDGMRQHLASDFSRIYHVNLQGDVKENPELSGTAYNVFGIQVGVGITLAIRRRGAVPTLMYHAVPKTWRREQKLDWLTRTRTASKVEWSTLSPDSRHQWIIPEHAAEYEILLPIGSKEAKTAASQSPETIFKIYSLGLSTNRDDVVYDFDREALSARMERFCDDYNAEIDRYLRKGKAANLDDFLDYTKVKWSRNLKRSLKNAQNLTFDRSYCRPALYRVFTKQHVYFADIAIDELGQIPKFVPSSVSTPINKIICCTNHTQIPFSVQMTDCVPDAAIAGRAGQSFPFYVYDEDGSNRRENITDWALNRFQQQYGDSSITKRDIFDYVYGLLLPPRRSCASWACPWRWARPAPGLPRHWPGRTESAAAHASGCRRTARGSPNGELRPPMPHPASGPSPRRASNWPTYT